MFKLFGDNLVSSIAGGGGGGVSDLRMADGLMTLVDAVNLKGVSLLASKVWGLEAECAGVGGGGHSRPIT